MTELSIFDFEGQEIRVFGSADTPEWVVADVGAVLGISQSTLSERVSKMPENWKGIGLTDTLGGQQQMLTVAEPGLYELIFRSDKPAAQRFRIWMFEEVLPSIRRTGSYSHSTEQVFDPQLSQFIELAQSQVDVINEQQKMLAEQQKMLATALASLGKTKAKDKKQPKWTPRSTSHLMEFVREVGLEPQPDGQVYVSDLWQQLRDWYIKTGVLKVETVKGKEKLTWRDLPNKRDNPVKAINQLSRRLCELFPKLQRRRHTGHDTGHDGKLRLGCSYLIGIGYAQDSALSGDDSHD
ncbi:BRO family protein [Microcoleus sp. bin38.metabat.b11b12b14.051]|uniref:BRO-N domain-containing protein n=1 Tax=Microcoleus sp. bin38.metabat.b11b12b14.051 TaxID=2742709 RepID=UPI0025D524CA|nr:BRO family protein [Microcoleus sp. bin38.metabat.b11b12b14.051]